MNKLIYLAWQDQKTRRWHVVGQLLRNKDEYEFRYTKGVENIPSFSALLNMPEHDKVYRSSELFSLFKNRLMPKSRPEYSDYMRWMGMKDSSMSELEALAISGGEKVTDFFRIIPVPEKNELGNYAFRFFVNGLNYMPEDAKERVNHLTANELLYLAHDFQNKEDPMAFLLRTEAPPCLIGYLPAYFTKVIHKIKNDGKANFMQTKVVQLNEDAPLQMRLLCELSFSHFKSWEHYEEEFKLIAP